MISGWPRKVYRVTGRGRVRDNWGGGIEPVLDGGSSGTRTAAAAQWLRRLQQQQ